MSARKRIKLNLGDNDTGNDKDDSSSQIAEEQQAAEATEKDTDRHPETQESTEKVSLSPDEIAALIKEKEEHYDRLLRTQADFDNYRKRVQKEQANLLRYGAENALVEILPVVDNIERAVSSAREHGESNAQLREGVELILNQFLDVLKKLGVTPIETVGHPFDPNKHDALLRVHAPDAEDGTVIEEVRKGYYLHDKVLRPAQVTVGTNESVEESENASEEAE
jgi:molecular chaperone GrpE